MIKEAFGQSVSGIQQATERLAELQGVLEGTARAQVAAIEAPGKRHGRLRQGGRGGGRLPRRRRRQAGGRGPRSSAPAFETFGPRIATLSSELGALGRELALQSARGPEGDLGAVVLGELERIGAGLDRLAELQRLGASGAAAGWAAPPAAELGAAPSAESFGARRDGRDAS